jgi:hypothetical protein
MSAYETVADFVAKIRNARFGEMVRHVEGLIEAGDWRDFTVPAGNVRYQFGSHEFDYFLVIMDIDAELVSMSYARAKDVEGLAAKEIRLADLTGRGKKPPKGTRRTWQDVSKALEGDPHGAGEKIAAAGRAHLFSLSEPGFVTITGGQVARDPERRNQAKRGQSVNRNVSKHRWEVKWSDDRPPAQAIVDRLLTDPELAREVYKRLHSHNVANAAKAKRRSVA